VTGEAVRLDAAQYRIPYWSIVISGKLALAVDFNNFRCFALIAGWALPPKANVQFVFLKRAERKFQNDLNQFRRFHQIHDFKACPAESFFQLAPVRTDDGLNDALIRPYW
jgi:hypothetical protein